ncbi:MAG: ABC transporter permease [Candidatus Methylomirabilales bacterium]
MADAPAPGTAARAVAKPPLSASPARVFWRRLARHRLAMTGAAIILLIVVQGLAAPLVLRADPEAIDVERILAPPSAGHWMGTDDFGRDLLARVVHGTRLSLLVGFSVLLFTLVMGAALGMLAGYFPAADAVIMRVMDALMAFPAILLALTVMAVAGPATVNVVAALGIAYSPRMARLARAAVLSVRVEEHIEAARALGTRPLRILLKHVVPNALAPIIVQGTFTFAYAILGEAALSFVGLGAVPPTPSLGNILADARAVIRDAPWMIAFPSLTLSLTILGLNLLGDGIRDVLDPRMRI